MIYIADTKQGVLREKAGMGKPDSQNYICYDMQSEERYYMAMDKYNTHIASLKQYPIIGDGWEDGKEYQDSEIGIATDYLPGGETKQYARLKQPEESQEQATIKLSDVLKAINETKLDSAFSGHYHWGAAMFKDQLVSKLFTITRK